jgi:hypothetical protein
MVYEISGNHMLIAVRERTPKKGLSIDIEPELSYFDEPLPSRIPSGTGNSPSQKYPDFINEAAVFRALGQVFLLSATPAGALDQIPDFKIKFIAFNHYSVFSNGVYLKLDN